MFTINLTKLDESREIDFDALPEASRTFVIAYGLKQLLNDAYASGKTADERAGLVDKKLKKLLDGTLGVREGRTATDPVYAEAFRMAKAAFKAKGRDAEADDEAEAVAKYIADERVQRAATAAVEAKRIEREKRRAAKAALAAVELPE